MPSTTKGLLRGKKKVMIGLCVSVTVDEASLLGFDAFNAMVLLRCCELGVRPFSSIFLIRSVPLYAFCNTLVLSI